MHNLVGSIAYEIHEGIWNPRDGKLEFRHVESFLTEEGANFAARRHYKKVTHRIVETKILSVFIPATEKT